MADMVYGVHCEWEIGLEYTVFRKPEDARAAAVEALEACGFDESYDELSASGLIGLKHFHLQ